MCLGVRDPRDDKEAIRAGRCWGLCDSIVRFYVPPSVLRVFIESRDVLCLSWVHLYRDTSCT